MVRARPGTTEETPTTSAVTPGVGRRTFLTGGAGAVAGAAATWLGTRAAADPAAPAPAPEDAAGTATVPWRGEHQAGVVTPPQAFGTLLAMDLADDVDRDALVRLMRVWTDDVDRLTTGRGGLSDTEPELAEVPARLTVTLGLGPGFFTAAGLEEQRPAWLAPLPAIGVDRLEDRWSGGDLVLQICADDPITVAHAVRLLTKEARSFASVRWVQQGFRNAPGTTPSGQTMRNLFGQVDGTTNPRTGMDDALIWTGGDGVPAWLEGGTTMVVRRIAMDVDRWDELDRAGREIVVGRDLDTGAPLTGGAEHDEVDLEATNELGFPVIDIASHVRRSRTSDPTQRILRRAYNYDVPPEPGRLSNSGLIFVAFQADLEHQFIPLQRRLDEMDLLNEWTVPIGSAVFAVPGGVRAEGEYLAQRLLEG